MSFQLTAGSCAQLQLSNFDEEVHNKEHVIQFLSVKKVTAPSANNVDRYRLIISDGVQFIQAMLATQCNSLVENDSLKKYAVAVVEKATCNSVQDKRLVILLSVRILGHPGEKIGEPVALTEGNGNVVAENSPLPNITNTNKASTITNTNKPSTSVVQPQQVQKPIQLPNKAGLRSTSIFPIEGLSPYQNNWTIKARVTQKSEIKTWSNTRGEGKLFNVTLMDDTGEIKATAFNTVVDELYSRLEEGKVYYISKARVNFAKRKFSNLPNEYELGLEKATQIEECHETTGLPQVKFNFVPLANLESVGKDGICDVIGVLKDSGPLAEITTRTNRQLQKRELTLVDKSGCSVQVTLWGKQAEQFNVEDRAVLAFKSVKVGDFGGISLSMTTSSLMQVNPEIEQCFALRGWYDSQGADMSFQPKTVTGGGPSIGFNRAEARSLNEVKESELGLGDKADYFSTRATIVHIRDQNLYYPGCPSPGCNKKITEDVGSWLCEKCGNRADAPEYRYIISLAVADWSGQAWLQGFNDAGNIIFGMTANELNELKSQDESKYSAVLHKANCRTYNFSCRAKKDAFEDRVRVRYGISRIEPINYRDEAYHMLDLLRSPWAQ